MVILIGGVSCTGKTVMAQKLLEKYHIPYLSIDHLKMGLIRGNRYCDFSATDGDDQIAEKLWPVVKGIIMTNIENKQNIIIEGCYLPPEYIKDFEPKYLKEITPLYIGFSKDYIDKHFDAGILGYISAIEQRKKDDYINPENFIKLHTQLKTRCERNKVPFFEIHDHYEAEMSNVYQWIDEQVKLKRSEGNG